MTSSDPVIAGVPLAQFAAVTAALAEGFPLRAVLSVEGLDAPRWAEADRGWTERLDQDPTLLARYQTDLVAAQERLLSRDEPPPEEGAPPKPPLRAGKARLIRSGTGVAPVIAPPTAASLAAPTQAPSFMAAAEQGIHAPKGPSYLTSSEPGLGTPAPKGPSYLTPPEPAPPAMASAPSFSVAPSIALPPAPEPARSPPPAHTLPPQDLVEPGSDDEGTTKVGYQRPEVFPFRASSIALGALGARAGAPVPKTIAAHHIETEVLPFRAPEHPVDDPATTTDDGSTRSAVVKVNALPFKPASSHEAVEATARPSIAAGEGSDGMTVTLPGPAAAALRNSDVREASSAPPSPSPQASPPMSLERHAYLCLELAVDPTRATEALARYEVTPAEKARADEYYRARIAVDPDLRAQWNRAYTAYHAWFTSRPRP